MSSENDPGRSWRASTACSTPSTVTRYACGPTSMIRTSRVAPPIRAASISGSRALATERLAPRVVTPGVPRVDRGAHGRDVLALDQRDRGRDDRDRVGVAAVGRHRKTLVLLRNEVGVVVAAAKARVFERPAVERDVRRRPLDAVLGERAQ